MKILKETDQEKFYIAESWVKGFIIAKTYRYNENYYRDKQCTQPIYPRPFPIR